MCDNFDCVAMASGVEHAETADGVGKNLFLMLTSGGFLVASFVPVVKLGASVAENSYAVDCRLKSIRIGIGWRNPAYLSFPD